MTDFTFEGCLTVGHHNNVMRKERQLLCIRKETTFAGYPQVQCNREAGYAGTHLLPRPNGTQNKQVTAAVTCSNNFVRSEQSYPVHPVMYHENDV